METICSFEMSVYFQRATRRYIPEDSILHNHRCENLKSYIALSCSQEPVFEPIPQPDEPCPQLLS
jgi:hypothetical protein